MNESRLKATAGSGEPAYRNIFGCLRNSGGKVSVVCLSAICDRALEPGGPPLGCWTGKTGKDPHEH